MAIVFAALTPHPPVLIPEVGKDNLDRLAKTQAAMQQLEQELYAAKPDSVVVLGPPSEAVGSSFQINLCANYRGGFKEFGEHSLQLEWRSDYMAIQQIRAADETQQQVPLTLTSNEELGHGFSVPLFYLLAHLKTIPIVPIITSSLGYQEHFDFGKFLHRQLTKINKRFAIIASGDLSHRLTKNAPGGFSKRGKEFDDELVKLLKSSDVKSLLGLDPVLAEEAAESVVRQLAVLLGLLDGMGVSPEVLSYEGPFGVGYTVVNYKFL